MADRLPKIPGVQDFSKAHVAPPAPSVSLPRREAPPVRGFANQEPAVRFPGTADKGPGGAPLSVVEHNLQQIGLLPYRNGGYRKGSITKERRAGVNKKGESVLLSPKDYAVLETEIDRAQIALDLFVNENPEVSRLAREAFKRAPEEQKRALVTAIHAKWPSATSEPIGGTKYGPSDYAKQIERALIREPDPALLQSRLEAAAEADMTGIDGAKQGSIGLTEGDGGFAGAAYGTDVVVRPDRSLETNEEIENEARRMKDAYGIDPLEQARAIDLGEWPSEPDKIYFPPRQRKPAPPVDAAGNPLVNTERVNDKLEQGRNKAAWPELPKTTSVTKTEDGKRLIVAQKVEGLDDARIPRDVHSQIAKARPIEEQINSLTDEYRNPETDEARRAEILDEFKVLVRQARSIEPTSDRNLTRMMDEELPPIQVFTKYLIRAVKGNNPQDWNSVWSRMRNQDVNRELVANAYDPETNETFDRSGIRWENWDRDQSYQGFVGQAFRIADQEMLSAAGLGTSRNGDPQRATWLNKSIEDVRNNPSLFSEATLTPEDVKTAPAISSRYEPQLDSKLDVEEWSRMQRETMSPEQWAEYESGMGSDLTQKDLDSLWRESNGGRASSSKKSGDDKIELEGADPAGFYSGFKPVGEGVAQRMGEPFDATASADFKEQMERLAGRRKFELDLYGQKAGAPEGVPAGWIKVPGEPAHNRITKRPPRGKDNAGWMKEGAATEFERWPERPDKWLPPMFINPEDVDDVSQMPLPGSGGRRQVVNNPPPAPSAPATPPTPTASKYEKAAQILKSKDQFGNEEVMWAGDVLKELQNQKATIASDLRMATSPEIGAAIKKKLAEIQSQIAAFDTSPADPTPSVTSKLNASATPINEPPPTPAKQTPAQPASEFSDDATLTHYKTIMNNKGGHPSMAAAKAYYDAAVAQGNQAVVKRLDEAIAARKELNKARASSPEPDPSEAPDAGETPPPEAPAPAGNTGAAPKDKDVRTGPNGEEYFYKGQWRKAKHVDDIDTVVGVGTKGQKGKTLSQMTSKELTFVVKDAYTASSGTKKLAQQELDRRASGAAPVGQSPAKPTGKKGGKKGGAAAAATQPSLPQTAQPPAQPPSQPPAPPPQQPTATTTTTPSPAPQQPSASQPPANPPPPPPPPPNTPASPAPSPSPSPGQNQSPGTATPPPVPPGGSPPSGNPPSNPPPLPNKTPWYGDASKWGKGMGAVALAGSAIAAAMSAANSISKIPPAPGPDLGEVPEQPAERAITKEAPTFPDQNGDRVPAPAIPQPAYQQQEQLSVHPMVAAMIQRSRQGVPVNSSPSPVPASQEPETIKPYRSMTAEERIRAFRGLNDRSYKSGTLSRY